MSGRDQKKKHHYIPIAYLNQFADQNGRIFAYRKDKPSPPLHIRPSEIGFERYYYSQPITGGGQDNNILEDFFSQIETHWPSLVNDLIAGRDIRDRMELLFQFIGLLRVRVPASRDPVELSLANMVRRTAKRLEQRGDLPPPPSGFETLIDDMEISIDPHQSIHAMVSLLKGFGSLMNYIGIEVVHNTSETPYITSDNPVIYFDPDIPESNLLPYPVRPPHRVELLLPVTPKLLIRGTTELPVIRSDMQPQHTQMRIGADVRRVNRMVARFGYRFVFASHAKLSKLVEKHAALSPTIKFDNTSIDSKGEFIPSQMVFGPRPRKPAWTRESTKDEK